MLKVARYVEAGNPELQDRAVYFWLQDTLVLVIADGAGGLPQAAETADHIVNRIKDASNSDWDELLRRIDREMADAGTYGESTCVIAAITGSQIAGASVGDSGAWLVSSTGAMDLTARQRRKPFMGTGAALPVTFHGALGDGTLLVASDGLLKYTRPQLIAEAAFEPDLEKGLHRLTSLVRYHSGALPDDLSILLARAG